MQNFLDSLCKNNKPRIKKTMLSSILFISAFFIVYAIITKCILQFETFNHQATIKNLNDQLSTAQNEEEIAIVNFLLKTENETWNKAIEANHDVFIISLTFSAALPIIYILYIALSRITDILFDALLLWTQRKH